MTDRIPVEVLGNGALRYAEYDSGGNFVQYRYLLLADGATVTGTSISKATLLSDSAANAIGDVTETTPSSDPTVSEAFTALAGKFLRIATGSYTGDGTAGSGNAQTLNFDFEPKLVIIQGNYEDFENGLIAVSGVTTIGSVFTSNDSGVFLNVTASWGADSFTWYSSTAAEKQMNESGKTYYYIAFGY
jgi:hypothetical protein